MSDPETRHVPFLEDDGRLPLDYLPEEVADAESKAAAAAQAATDAQGYRDEANTHATAAETIQTEMQGVLDDFIDEGFPLATPSAPGLMSGPDKSKVDESASEDYVDTEVSSATSGLASESYVDNATENQMVVVNHGTSSSTSRPDAAAVYWIGSAEPSNKQDGDLWMEV